MNIGRTLRTVSHLKGSQLAALARQRFRRAISADQPRLPRQASPLPALSWQESLSFNGRLLACPMPDISKGRMCFLNDARNVGFPPDWSPSGASRLWTYNQHYFEFLWSTDFGSARAVVLDWIARQLEPKMRPGWEPYPTSLRLINWCAYFFGAHRQEAVRDVALANMLWESVRAQAHHLHRNLETHLLGNHLLENAAALAFVGSCFSSNEAHEWARAGRRLLEVQVPEQLLGDGGHFERSPMYHSRVLCVLNLLQQAGAMRLDDDIERATKWLSEMCHPDGRIALFNDAAFGVCPSLDAIGVTPATPGHLQLADSGYFGARTSDGHCVICDAGSIGPDYQPGHAHGDIFSFELSVHGHRVVTDSGVFDYESGEMRDYCRSTRAHNTVEIEGKDQCEFWAAFRVGRRGQVHDVRFEQLGDGFRLSGSHNGYRHLPGRPVHVRTFRWHDSGVLMIRDRVDATSQVRAVARVHFHPACSVAEAHQESVVLDSPAGKVWLVAGGDCAVRVGESWYCPEFAIRQSRVCVTIDFSGLGTRNCAMMLSCGEQPQGLDIQKGARVNGITIDW